MWYSPIAVAVVIIVGLIVSYITGSTKSNEIDSKLIISLNDRCYCCLPKSIRGWFQSDTPDDACLEKKVCLSIK